MASSTVDVIDSQSPPSGEWDILEVRLGLGRLLSIRTAPPEKTTAHVGYDTYTHVWPSAISLMAYLQEQSPHFASDAAESEGLSLVKAGTRMIELGAGTGALGLFLAYRVGAHVTLTDLPEALPLLKQNVHANSNLGPSNIKIRAMHWGTSTTQLDVDVRREIPYELVLASDCCYDGTCVPLLLNSIRTLISPMDDSGKSAGRALITISGRPGEKDNVLSAIAASGMSARHLHTSSPESSNNTLISLPRDKAHHSSARLAQLLGAHVVHVYLLTLCTCTDNEARPEASLSLWGNEQPGIEINAMAPQLSTQNLQNAGELAARIERARVVVEAMGMQWPGDEVIAAGLKERLANLSSQPDLHDGEPSHVSEKKPTPCRSYGSIAFNVNLSTEISTLAKLQPEYIVEHFTSVGVHEAVVHVNLAWLEWGADNSLPLAEMTNGGLGLSLVSAPGAVGPPYQVDIIEIGCDSVPYMLQTMSMVKGTSGSVELQVRLTASCMESFLGELD